VSDQDIFKRLAELCECATGNTAGREAKSALYSLADELRREPDSALQRRADMADRGWCQACGHHRDVHDPACTFSGCRCNGWSRFPAADEPKTEAANQPHPARPRARRIAELEQELIDCRRERDACKRDFDAELESNAALRATYGAKDNETMPQLIERLWNLREHASAIEKRKAERIAELELTIERAAGKGDAYWRGIVAQRDDAVERATLAEQRSGELWNAIYNPPTFKSAWAAKEASGYQYGPNALEQVKFGWEIAFTAVRDVVVAEAAIRPAFKMTALEDEVVELKSANTMLRKIITDDRNVRQVGVFEWVLATFGEANATPKERARRFFEEAVELAQAASLGAEDLERVVKHVLKKPPGDPVQELGGVGVTLLAYAESIRCSADGAEENEYRRACGIEKDFFLKRHDAKVAAGIAVKCDGDKPA